MRLPIAFSIVITLVFLIMYSYLYGYMKSETICGKTTKTDDQFLEELRYLKEKIIN